MAIPRARTDLARLGAWSAAIGHAPRVLGGAAVTNRRAQLIKEIFWMGVTLTPAFSVSFLPMCHRCGRVSRCVGGVDSYIIGGVSKWCYFALPRPLLLPLSLAIIFLQKPARSLAPSASERAGFPAKNDATRVTRADVRALPRAARRLSLFWLKSSRTARRGYPWVWTRRKKNKSTQQRFTSVDRFLKKMWW